MNDNDVSLTAFYFPGTYIRQEFLKPALLLFDGLTIYQPSEWQPSAPHKDIVNAGLLRYETPFPAGPELPDLKRAVKQILSWGDQAFTSGQLHYLKHLDQTSPDEAGSEILSALRGEKKEEPAADPIISARIFLHLAQEFDQRQDEINVMNSEIRSKEDQLWSGLLSDQENAPVRPALFPEIEDTVAISARLKAWSSLFGNCLGGKDLPLTTDPSIMELLPAHISLLTIPLPNLDQKKVSEIMEMRGSPEISEATTVVKRHLVKIIRKLSATRIEDVMLEELLGDHLEAIKVLEGISAADGGDHVPYRLSLFLVPEIPIRNIFSSGTPEKENGFVFLLRKGT